MAVFGSPSYFSRYQCTVFLPVTEGSISFTVKMSPEFSPALQIVAYVILPSENVIAHKADLTVTKCFLNKVGWCTGQRWTSTSSIASLLVPEDVRSTSNLLSARQVSVEFSPTSAVPGEETTLQVKALPDSLCGVSVIDQSVLVKEPGKTLTADQVTSRARVD